MTPSSKRLYQDIIIRALSDFFVLVFNLLILRIMTKNLGTSGYGAFSQIMATVGFLTPLLLLRMDTACVRFFPSILNNKSEIKKKFLSLFLLIIIVVIVVSSIAVLFKKQVSIITFGSDSYLYLINLMFLFVFLRVTGTYLNNFYRALNKTRYSSLFEVIRFFLVSVFLFITLQKMNLGLKGFLISFILSEAILVLILILLIFSQHLKGVKGGIDYSGISPYFRYSIPLIPYSVFVWINELGDRYLITHLLGLNEAGIYSVAYTISKYAFILQSAISFVIYPYVSQLWARREYLQVKSFLERGQNLFLFYAIPVAFGLTILGPEIIKVFAGEGFLVDRQLILLIAIGYIFLGLFQINGYIIDLSQKTFLFLIVLIITATVNIGLNLFLIPLIGIKGAAISTFVTYLIQSTIIMILSPTLVNFRIGFNFGFLLKCLVGSIIMAFIIGLIRFDNKIVYLTVSLFTGSTLYIIIMYFFTNRFYGYDIRSAVNILGFRK